MSWVFVYGTLRQGGRAEALLEHGVLERRPAVLVGHALYGRRQPYPWAIPDPESTVVGEAVRLDPRLAPGILTELDTYEGDEYCRIRHRVLVEDGEVVADLWIAAGIRSPEEERIPSGDWFRRDL